MPLLENSPNHLQSNLIPNQNVMHVKFHANKYQDNLLSKRLQQLNSEEMKLRLKHQRTSNELILFLRECKKTTGYYAKMKSFQSNSLIVCDNTSKDFKSSSKSTFESKSTLDLVNNVKFRSSSFSAQAKLNKDFENRKKISSDETRLKNINLVKQRLDLKEGQKTLFEHILQSPGSTSPRNSASSRSQFTTSSKLSTPEYKQQLSDRSSTASLSSNSCESFEIFNKTEKKIRPVTSQVDSRRLLKRTTDNKFVSVSTRSHLEWVNTNISLDLDSLNKNKPKNEDNVSRKSSTSGSSITSKSTSSSIYTKSEFMTHTPKFSEKLPVKSSQSSINPPIRINMSRSSMKKKQIEIMNEYNRTSTLELMDNLRKIQQDMDNRVKQFTQNSFS